MSDTYGGPGGRAQQSSATSCANARQAYHVPIAPLKGVATILPGHCSCTASPRKTGVLHLEAHLPRPAAGGVDIRVVRRCA